MASGSQPQPSTPTPSGADDKGFQSWRRRFSLITGLGLSETDKAARTTEAQCKQCEKWKYDLLHYSPAVVFMFQQLRHIGSKVTPDHLVCTPCGELQAGGFLPTSGAIVLCQGKFIHKKHMESTIVHELVHLYDQSKFKVDWDNLRHHACSEIRANSLSGDCRWSREFFDRLQPNFSKQHQVCVRRRAIQSVAANPRCPDVAAAERAVNEVWESCLNDTRPFDEFPPM
ncbi:peptidase M76 family-domain-containing protein [Irpex rosettiformis]|uniref:Peptidase M76 family-domain-containing protein n=1 Tax=Irpex rosettiformis TaxID=378272 RepID=A0ACB8ULM7_9APHY|nr:peptidase M76 family-domain-containing protein [Irpex rosettiformis]